MILLIECSQQRRIKMNNYTLEFIDPNKVKNNQKEIVVEAANGVEAKEKILKLLTKLNSKIIRIRTVNKSDNYYPGQTSLEDSISKMPQHE